jgi:elongation factor P--beta-lysine ligase
VQGKVSRRSYAMKKKSRPSYQSPKRVEERGEIHRNIIPFHDYKRVEVDYEELIEELKEYLEDVRIELRTKAINLAVKIAWRRWDESLDIGDEFQFSDDMLLDTGDPNVETLIELAMHTEDVLDYVDVENVRY